MAADNETLKGLIDQWRSQLSRRAALRPSDLAELEGHLRDQMAALTETGLTDDEAFLVAAKRLGNLDAVSQEFAKEHSDRLWKQLVADSAPESAPARSSSVELVLVIALALAAAAAIKVPQLFGFAFFGELEEASFYARNLSFFVLPLLTGYLAWKRQLPAARRPWLALPFVVAAVLVNSYPLVPDGVTLILVALHLPIALWLVVGVAYTGGRWPWDGDWYDGYMNFIRFSGELFIYYLLIVMGGGALIGLMALLFSAIEVDASWLLLEWVAPCGAMGAVLIAAWLVEAKQSVIENIAPVLARVFTPLVALALLTFLATMLWTGQGIGAEREALIGFDLLLVLVLGLLLYSLSARDPQAPPNLFDWLTALLVVCALIADAMALTAITARITEFGFSANKTAALGENIILLVNLAWSAWLYARFLWRRSASFAALERWQTAYLPVYAGWAAVVVVAFPPVFGWK